LFGINAHSKCKQIRKPITKQGLSFNELVDDEGKVEVVLLMMMTTPLAADLWGQR
jgi:hypothetical protein